MKAVFIGLGSMGAPMATNILDAGLPLGVYNRNAAKAEPFVQLGATVYTDPAEAVSGSDLVFTMLADDAALASVMSDTHIQSMASGGVHISLSTISVDLSARLAETHARSGSGYLGCPVLGRPDAAASGALHLCLAGSAVGKERVLPYLNPMGKVWDFGDSPANAHAVKLAVNFMFGSIMEALAEAFTLVENNGIAPERFYELLTGSILNVPTVKNYGRLMLDGNFDQAGFTARLGAKDFGLVRAAAKASRTPMPMASLVEDRLIRVLAHGWGEKDWSVIGLAQREDAGLIAR